MAQTSGFFNALLTDGVYDRTYTADDYCDNLAVVISNGVLRSTGDDLKVTASGLILSVAAGRGWINGHWYNNDAAHAFAAISLPVSGKRYDRVVLRFDNTLAERTVSLDILKGTVADSPSKPELTRTDAIYELCLADVYVEAGATSLGITDTRADTDLCGWVYSTSGDNSFFAALDGTFYDWFKEKKNTLSSVTLFKRYNWRTVLTTQATSVSFDISQYDPETCFLEVYVNGILEAETADYTLNTATNVINFTGTLIAGTEVEVKCYKSIDGTGITSVADEITALQNQYATISGVSKFTYNCTGVNDNVTLSQIAQAFISGSYDASSVTDAANAFLTALGGNTYLGNLYDEAQVTIDVVGRLGATSPYGGSGTDTSRYRWFSLGSVNSSAKRIRFDFSKCEKISLNCSEASKNYIVFYGTDLFIDGANVYAYSNATGVTVTMFAGSANTGDIEVNDSYLSISTSGTATIAENGTYTNCTCRCVSRASHALCFVPRSVSLVRLIGGTYFAYIAASGMASAIIYVYATDTNAVAMAHNINAPTVAFTGYSQQYLSVAYAGGVYINGVCSTMTVSGGKTTVAGQIWKSKQ